MSLIHRHSNFPSFNSFFVTTATRRVGGAREWMLVSGDVTSAGSAVNVIFNGACKVDKTRFSATFQNLLFPHRYNHHSALLHY